MIAARPALLLSLLLLAPPLRAQELPPPVDLARHLEQAFVDVADALLPAVVTVEVTRTAESDFQANYEGSPEELQRHLEELERLFGQPGSGAPQSHEVRGMGSGFVVDADGTIYTNNHVIDSAALIEVVLADGRRFKADLVGADVESDVAVLRLLSPPEDLAVAPLGDSDAVRVGQFAIAIGSPAGFTSSFTVGHVSALGRDTIGEFEGGWRMPGFENLVYQDFLQVDAPINVGNSGGPLVNISGEVIGINTAIVTGGAAMGGPVSGIGFSIPINMARDIGQQLVECGHVVRGWLGVTMSDLNANLKEVYGVGAERGAVVNEIIEDSPAGRSGLLPHDVVVRLGERDIGSSKDLQRAVAGAPVGQELTARIWRANEKRGGEFLELVIVPTQRPTVAEQASLFGGAGATVADGGSPVEGWLFETLGLAVTPAPKGAVARALRREQGPAASKGAPRGVKVLRVEPGSASAEAGLQPGDIIASVDHDPVSGPAGLVRHLRDAERPFLPLLVIHDGETAHLAVEVPR